MTANEAGEMTGKTTNKHLARMQNKYVTVCAASIDVFFVVWKLHRKRSGFTCTTV